MDGILFSSIKIDISLLRVMLSIATHNTPFEFVVRGKIIEVYKAK